MRSISIRTWQEPFPSRDGIAVVFDIFRCSSTILELLRHDTNNIFVAKSLDPLKSQATNLRIFSELPEQLKCRARHDNSPTLARDSLSSDLSAGPVVVATTSGTPALFAARGFAEIWMAGLANFSAVVGALAEEERAITLIPAAASDSSHLEDGIVAQELAIALDGFCLDEEFVRRCGEICIERIRESGRVEELTERLSTGAEDCRLALNLDRHRFLAKIDFAQNLRIPGTAKVIRCNIG